MSAPTPTPQPDAAPLLLRSARWRLAWALVLGAAVVALACWAVQAAGG